MRIVKSYVKRCLVHCKGSENVRNPNFKIKVDSRCIRFRIDWRMPNPMPALFCRLNHHPCYTLRRKLCTSAHSSSTQYALSNAEANVEDKEWIWKCQRCVNHPFLRQPVSSDSENNNHTISKVGTLLCTTEPQFLKAQCPYALMFSTYYVQDFVCFIASSF